MTRLSFCRWLFALLGCAVAALGAAPVETDLGSGLVYVRVHELPADLPSKPATERVRPCVIDLRYVQGGAEEATTFMAWLKFRATQRAPVFVVANSATSGALRTALAAHERSSGIVVVGIPGEGFRPDVAAKGSADTERNAYNAFEQGSALAKLLAENPDKVRNDEASLSKDRLAEASADAADDVIKGKRAAPPLDAALQRAVHLHRALVALKKI